MKWLFLIILSWEVHSQEPPIIQWAFETQGKIFSNPITDGKLVFFGSDDGHFYAVEGANGNRLWAYNASGPIRSQAILWKDSVIF